MTEAFRLGFMHKLAELRKAAADFADSDEWKATASDPASWEETMRLGERGAAVRRAANGATGGTRITTGRPLPPIERPGTPVPLDPVDLGRKGPGGYEKNPGPYTFPKGVGEKPLTAEQREEESRAFKEKWKKNPSIGWHSRDEYDDGLNPKVTAPRPSAAPAARPAPAPAARPVAPAARPAPAPAARPVAPAAPAAPAARPAARPSAAPAAPSAPTATPGPTTAPTAAPAAPSAPTATPGPTTAPTAAPAARPKREFRVRYDEKTGKYRRADPNDTTPWTEGEKRGLERLHKEKGRTTPIVW